MIENARGHLRGRARLPDARGRHKHPLRPAEPDTLGARSARSRADARDPRCSRGLPAGLRAAKDLARAAPARCSSRPRPGGAADARKKGLSGIRRGRGVRTTRSEAAADRARDLVERRFCADRPNRLWVADMTYVRTYAGFVYLAVILDVFSRRIVGWQIACHMRTELVMDALEMAVATRTPGRGLIAHTDRGSQYTSLAYTDRLDELGIAPSVGSTRRRLRQRHGRVVRGDLQVGARRRAQVPGPRARRARGPCLDRLLQPERLHEELGDIPPAEFEAEFLDDQLPGR